MLDSTFKFFIIFFEESFLENIIFSPADINSIDFQRLDPPCIPTVDVV